MSSNSSREQTTVSFVRFYFTLCAIRAMRRCASAGTAGDVTPPADVPHGRSAFLTRGLHKALPNTRFVKTSARLFSPRLPGQPGQFHPARRAVLQSKRALLFRQPPFLQLPPHSIRGELVEDTQFIPHRQGMKTSVSVSPPRHRQLVRWSPST